MPLHDQENQNLAGRSRRQHRDPQADRQEQAQSKNQRARDLENKSQWTQIETKPHWRKQAEGDAGSKKQGMKRKNLARKKNLKIVGICAVAWHRHIVVPFWFRNVDFVNSKREYFMLRRVEGDCETAYFSLVSIFTYRLIIVPFWFCKFGLVNLKTKCGLRDRI